jgi:hypothetical protein
VNNEKKFLLLRQLILKMLNFESVYQYLEMLFPMNLSPRTSIKSCSSDITCSMVLTL